MIITYISLFIIYVYLIIKGKKALHMLQQNLYNENNRYFKWIKGNLLVSFFNLDIISMGLLIAAAIYKNDILIVVALIIYLLDAYIIINARKTEQVKKPLVITARVKRLLVTITLLYLIPVAVIYFDNSLNYLMIMVLGLMTLLEYIIVLLAKFINRPIERLVYLKYYFKAQRKLKTMTNLSVVGITGSYGKTSSKNILADILNIKYITRPTPKNLNTEYGLMITINNHLDKYDQVFIAEMGAYTNGEIKTLCDMVHPKYGILTRVGTAHLETFKTRENIQKTKFELIESLPSDGLAVLNKDDEWQTSYNLKNDVSVVWIGIENQDADIVALNIKCSEKGSRFDIKFKGDEKLYSFETRLLGQNNIYNILASVALGKHMGMSINDLQAGVRKVRSIEHRLELKDLGGMFMIDDAYNSNPVGAKMAVEVLSMMPGVKVVVTPGMIELGNKQDEYNFEFGKQIADSKPDYVILIGEKITKPIYNGLIDAGYDKEKIHILNNVVDSYPLVRKLANGKEVYALYENDLPDSYNEK